MSTTPSLASRLVASLRESLGAAYTIERELGGGGVSRVFLAEDTRSGRPAVVKLLSPELGVRVSAERFGCEIKLAAVDGRGDSCGAASRRRVRTTVAPTASCD